MLDVGFVPSLSGVLEPAAGSLGWLSAQGVSGDERAPRSCRGLRLGRMGQRPVPPRPQAEAQGSAAACTAHTVAALRGRAHLLLRGLFCKREDSRRPHSFQGDSVYSPLDSESSS